MSITVEVEIACDYCGTTLSGDYGLTCHNKKQAKATARANGWRIGDHDKCPECVNRQG